MAIKLARLPTNWQDQPKLVERYWDSAMTEIEKTLNAILAIPLIEDALADLDTAIVAADAAAAAANAAAVTANNTATSITSESSLVNSFPDNFTAPLVSADNLGNVTIATHDRVYGDSVLNPTVSVIGTVLATAAVPTDIVRIYYNDATRVGGAVTYLFTVDPAPPPVQGSDVHSVGAVEIPAAGTLGGKSVTPPGYVEI